MCIDRATRCNRSQRGLSLIELIVFIVIVGVALSGILTVLNLTTKSSADPMIRKQMLSIAEALLEEVQMKAFTWCDPDDRSAATAESATLDTTLPTPTDVTKCWDKLEGTGPETIASVAETRTSTSTPFDNVNDFSGLAMLASPISSSRGGTSTAPAGYSAKIDVTPEALNDVGDATSASASLHITVTVCHATSCPSGDSVTLEGYRTRHSPNFLP